VPVGGGDRTMSRGTGAREEGRGAEIGHLAGSREQRHWRLRSFRVRGGSGALLGDTLMMSAWGAPVMVSAMGGVGEGALATRADAGEACWRRDIDGRRDSGIGEGDEIAGGMQGRNTRAYKGGMQGGRRAWAFTAPLVGARARGRKEDARGRGRDAGRKMHSGGGGMQGRKTRAGGAR
jgi:hypothetical protein